MRPIHFITPIILGIILFALAPIKAQADRLTNSAAASYSRTLFDATLGAGNISAAQCGDIRDFGRFAAGRLWQALPETERSKFDGAFCALANTAVERLKAAYPDLALTVLDSQAAPQNMISLNGLLTGRHDNHWPVDWLIAGTSDSPHLADLRILGVSLGIFLRTTAILERPDKRPKSLTSDQILRPWRQALDRALPPAIRPWPR